MGGFNFPTISRPIYSLELPRLYQGQPNVEKKCCIPAGVYPLTKYESPHFSEKAGKPVFVLLLGNVSDRSDIEIHSMNVPCDSLGCIGAGYDEADDMILDSRAAIAEIYAVGFAAIDSGDGAEIEVIDIPPDSPAAQ